MKFCNWRLRQFIYKNNDHLASWPNFCAQFGYEKYENMVILFLLYYTGSQKRHRHVASFNKLVNFIHQVAASR